MAYNISDKTLEDIKAQIDIADLISSYGVDLKRAGGNYKACCPFHHEKTPSFVVQPSKGFYHCFGCGESGDVFNFVMKQEGLSFIDAVKRLAQQCGINIETTVDPEADKRKRLYALLSELATFYRRCLLQADEAKSARAYLEKRAIPNEWAETFCIGYAPQGSAPILKWAQKYHFSEAELYAAGVLTPPRYANDLPYHPFSGRLMFTICDRQGRPVAFSGRILDAAKSPRKYVNSPETLVFKKSHILFGLDKAAPFIVKTPHREAIVCEGQIDLIRCHASGFQNTVASQGTAFTQEHVQLLKRCADSVTLVFDADGAGRKAAIRTGGEFLAAEIPVRVATLPAGEDPDSLLREKGPTAFQACLDHSESITHFQVRTLLAAEERPDSIDAIARISKTALETIALCPSAILRSSLMAEAAELLHIPVAALQEDFNKLKHAVSRKIPSVTTTTTTRNNTPTQTTPTKATYVPPPDLPPEDFYIDSEPPPNLNAAASVNNPPPKIEKELCAMLLDNEDDAEVKRLVQQYIPSAILKHEWTQQFVSNWLKGGTKDLITWRNSLSKIEAKWLNNLLLNSHRETISELSAVELLQNELLRNLWIEATQRSLGMMSINQSETEIRRLQLTNVMLLLRRAPWEKARQLMNPSLIG